MLRWLANVFGGLAGRVTGDISAFINGFTVTIQNVLSTTYTYWHTVSGNVRGQWSRMPTNTHYALTSFAGFCDAVYKRFVYIERVQFKSIVAQITLEHDRMIHDVTAVENYESARTDAKVAAEHSYARSILAWVIIHVLTFLYLLIKAIFSWIAGAGSTMWHYFTHLADFADLLLLPLAAAFELASWDIAAKLGQFFLSLIVRNVVKFATLVESIVDAVL
jgi:hypothetical protein